MAGFDISSNCRRDTVDLRRLLHRAVSEGFVEVTRYHMRKLKRSAEKRRERREEWQLFAAGVVLILACIALGAWQGHLMVSGKVNTSATASAAEEGHTADLRGQDHRGGFQRQAWRGG